MLVFLAMTLLTHVQQLFALGNIDLSKYFANTALYASNLPPGVVFPYWEDLVAGNSAEQGIYYQIDNYGSNIQLSVEYILTAYNDLGSSSPTLYQFMLTYDSDAPAVFSLFYFSAGDGGANATIGVQGMDSSSSKYLANV